MLHKFWFIFTIFFPRPNNRIILTDIFLDILALLLYRICRCCRRIYVKLLHTLFHVIAIPCVALGFLAVLESHNRATPEPIPNFYSLHSWMGLVTMGLFAMQVFRVVIGVVVFACQLIFNIDEWRISLTSE